MEVDERLSMGMPLPMVRLGRGGACGQRHKRTKVLEEGLPKGATQVWRGDLGELSGGLPCGLYG